MTINIVLGFPCSMALSGNYSSMQAKSDTFDMNSFPSLQSVLV